MVSCSSVSNASGGVTTDLILKGSECRAQLCRVLCESWKNYRRQGKARLAGRAPDRCQKKMRAGREAKD
ncbi:uncharacterized protein L969DRAFT_91955 [Mixia osmundae IAM 14324]|uniref:Uncharacterized protein n=1 Tax=Mixia osmundae (strain CBS 9802 / IAM 14324 / JCM 22182 / KY 12970) TaxID=764103 RepID=G7E315_MIXOS|nr:uncharacterized protein L969DRAFT_91955 [Mixia osmundae IAM 14324]KEI42515.1 hypothetical protein L969DRAFT_91955 [Mixia osmundae IAM 14324]GAA97196.1 hypothetical protein E5Q_03872 [Mixia osmundae IAM 14324]